MTVASPALGGGGVCVSQWGSPTSENPVSHRKESWVESRFGIFVDFHKHYPDYLAAPGTQGEQDLGDAASGEGDSLRE